MSWTKVVKHPKEIVEKGQKLEVRILEVSRDNRRISLGYRQVQDDPWPELVNYFEAGKEVSGEIIRILDKGIIINMENEVEGIIPFGKMSKKDRKTLAGQYEIGANLSGIVMKVSPEDKKVILYKEELAGTTKRTSANDEVKQYLNNQEIDSGEKLELPQELLDIASQAEKETTERTCHHKKSFSSVLSVSKERVLLDGCGCLCRTTIRCTIIGCNKTGIARARENRCAWEGVSRMVCCGCRTGIQCSIFMPYKDIGDGITVSIL